MVRDKLQVMQKIIAEMKKELLQIFEESFSYSLLCCATE
jgi:hypothetical protein